MRDIRHVLASAVLSVIRFGCAASLKFITLIPSAD
ncbi:MAG: hypothetical protein JWP03_1523 [Phycisphaerales bacterium]|jgi:hypothetical protein|nr:hypothetical protein [Phycisphaerales bacterium]